MYIFQTGLQALDTLVQGVIGGQVDHIEAGPDQRVGSFGGRGKIGISTDLSGEHDLLVDKCKVAVLDDLGHMLIEV